MTRRNASRRRRGEDAGTIGVKLIGAGLVLGLLPMFLGSNPLAIGLRPLAPIGWLMFLVGGVLVWWRLRGNSAASGALPNLDRKGPTSTLRRPSVAPRVTRRSSSSDADVAASLAGAPPVVTPERWGKDVFDVIEWRRFEAVVETLFAQAGFETKSQTHGADGGIDIWLHSRSQGGAAVSIVQCKHWTSKPVGVDKIRELRGVMAANNISRGQFATTSTFTSDAITFARSNAVNLLDVEGLLALIATRTEAQQRALLDVALDGEYWRPTCASCGIKLVKRESQSGGEGFWGCANFPRCRTRMQVRRASSRSKFAT